MDRQPARAKIKRKRFSKKEKERLLERQRYKCNHCQQRLTEAREYDHIKPLFVGGRDSIFNLQVLCCNCHALKSKRDARQISKLSKYVIYCKQCQTRFSPWFGRHHCTNWKPL